MIEDECIEWDGAVTNNGYGIRRIAGKNYYVHRLGWEEEHGAIPDGMFILHRCDNKPCFLVKHLFLGTQADNVHDMLDKGRGGNQKKTHCKRGHLLAGTNLRDEDSAIRQCRVCRNLLRRGRR